MIDYQGIRYGKIAPTDIDGVIEYHNEAFVFYEFKHRETMIPLGQQLMYERLADDLQAAGVPAVVFQCSHSVDDTQQDVIAANARVVRTYYDGKWTDKDGSRTVKDHTDAFIRWIEDKKRF